MKKSSIFKILTLFLTFVIFSCCSGCFLSFVKCTSERRLQEALVIQKEKKALADALIPEIEGYTFETRPESYFLGKEDWESQGFKIYSIFFASRDSFECRLERISENIEKYCVYRYQSNKIDLDQIGYVIPTEEQKAVFEIFPIFVTQSILYVNEEFFLYSEMYSELYGWNAAGAIALFLLDFEKHKMYYVGYSKGWIEAELEDNQLYHWRRMCFKLTKS